MPRFFDPLLRLISRSSDPELLAQVQFLKAENRILRSKLPKRVLLTPQEKRRLIELGQTLRWSVMKELISVVSPWTFARWIRQHKKVAYPRGYEQRGPKVGRPGIPDELRELVIQIARETGLGYTRIHGELNKLGITLARSTIVNILKGAGMSPDPHRGEGRWDEFLKMHAKTLWACDFLCVNAWTMKGLRQFYLILFIHHQSRRIHVTPATMHPTHYWVSQQARNFCMVTSEIEQPAAEILRDRDKKFEGAFDGILRAQGITPIILSRNSPNLNAIAERVIQSLKQECLDHFVILGERHLNYLVQEYVEFYNHHRPHSRIGCLPPLRAGPPTTTGEIRCDAKLGGLLKHYYRQAA